MKRMLYLNNQDEYEGSDKTSDTNSFKTDTSWEGISADGDNPSKSQSNLNPKEEKKVKTP
jgi:hypothetical protein